MKTSRKRRASRPIAYTAFTKVGYLPCRIGGHAYARPRATLAAMVGPWPHRAFTFRALAKTFGQMWVRCDVCRRYARLRLAGLRDVDYRTKTFSCSRCGAEAYLCLVEPIKERGMADYRLDEVELPSRHPEAARRLTRQGNRRPVSMGGGELPGRKVDPRR